MHSDQINEIATALAKAQAEIIGAKEDRLNSFINYKYAALSSVWDACRTALTKNGLSVSQIIQQHENGDNLCTMLMHSSGQWLKSIIPIKVKVQMTKSGKEMNELQTLGSTLTYLRRYALSALVGVAPYEEDDDGQSSSTSYGNQEQKLKKPVPLSKQQVDLLNSTLSQCSEGFRKRFDNFMKENGYASPNLLTTKQFQEVINEAKLDIAQSKSEALNGNLPDD